MFQLRIERNLIKNFYKLEKNLASHILPVQSRKLKLLVLQKNENIKKKLTILKRQIESLPNKEAKENAN